MDFYGCAMSNISCFILILNTFQQFFHDLNMISFDNCWESLIQRCNQYRIYNSTSLTFRKII